jgi:hypothetical protein
MRRTPITRNSTFDHVQCGLGYGRVYAEAGDLSCRPRTVYLP